MNVLYRISIIIYVFVNALFIYKYGYRQNYVNPLLLVFIYSIFIFGLFFLKQKNIVLIKNDKKYKYIYIGIIIISTIIFSFIVFNIDGDNLNVDRWSALEITVESIINGQYPYTRLDHMGQMTSNFPALGFIALPFYYLGDVGYLQVFVYIIFSVYLYKSTSIRTALFINLLYLFSPALLWEIAVKSDLVSNIMLVILFIQYWKRKHNNILEKPILLGGVLTFLLLTRGIVVIPLIIFFFKDLLISKFNVKIKFIISSVIFGIIISSPILFTVPNWNTLINYNPLVIQTNKAPIFSYILLILTFVIPFLVKNRNNYNFYIAIIIFLIPFTAFVNSIIHNSWYSTIFEHKYDISYLSMCLPPIIFWIKEYVENKLDLKESI